MDSLKFLSGPLSIPGSSLPNILTLSVTSSMAKFSNQQTPKTLLTLSMEEFSFKTACLIRHYLTHTLPLNVMCLFMAFIIRSETSIVTCSLVRFSLRSLQKCVSLKFKTFL